MQDCQVCGRSFDPLGFQVVVPELGEGFDRIECAHSARALAAPGTRIAATPLIAVVEPIGAPASAGGAGAALRSIGAPAATLGLLASGTAAAAFLWLRVLGPETAGFPLSFAETPPAAAQETVQAYAQPVPDAARGSVAATPRERGAPDSVATLVDARREPTDRSPGGTSSGRENSPGRSGATRPTARTTRPEPAKTTGKDHVKRGLGHYKHGETDGVHAPGHGQGHGGHGNRGHGKGR
jgi:hypothetical protein